MSFGLYGMGLRWSQGSSVDKDKIILEKVSNYNAAVRRVKKIKVETNKQ